MSQNPLDRYFESLDEALAHLPCEMESDLRQEARQHLECLVEAYVEMGQSRDEAVRLAVERFGPPARLTAGLTASHTSLIELIGEREVLERIPPLYAACSAALITGLGFTPGWGDFNTFAACAVAATVLVIMNFPLGAALASGRLNRLRNAPYALLLIACAAGAVTGGADSAPLLLAGYFGSVSLTAGALAGGTVRLFRKWRGPRRLARG